VSEQNWDVSETNDHHVTIIVSPHERFGVAVESLQSVAKETRAPFRLVYVDAGSPLAVSAEIARLCAANGWTHLRIDGFLTPNQARNRGLREARSRHVVFLDNDVIVAPGWLDALVRCAEETGAEIVVPLTCQKLPLHTEIHQAGGSFAADPQRFFANPTAEQLIEREHHLQGEKVADVTLERGDTQCCEFHCALVRRDVLLRHGGLDEGLMATREHIDFSMTVLRDGGRLVFEPASVVTYVFPNRASPLRREDWAFFALRWSPQWQRRSLEHFSRKWGLGDGSYFRKREKALSWRHNIGIARPLVRRTPLLTRAPGVERIAAGLVTRVLGMWSGAMALAHRRRTPPRIAPGVAVAPQAAE